MKKFKSKTTEEKFKRWINAHPESWHPYDYERFHDFITSLFLENEHISESELRNSVLESKEWKNEEFINEFVNEVTTKISELRSFFDYLNEKNRINAT